MNCTLDELKQFWKLEKIPTSWQSCFSDAISSFHFSWLDNYNFEKICHFYHLPSSFCCDLLKTIEFLKVNYLPSFTCYLFHYILYHSNYSSDIWTWDFDKNFSDSYSALIPAIALLSSYPLHIDTMHKRNYSDDQIKRHQQNICQNIINDYSTIKQLRFRHMVWLSIFMKCNIIEIGRLQYNYHPEKLDSLQNNTYSIELHIPGGAKLNLDEVKQSLKDAPTYIYQYFELDTSCKLQYYVKSWLFSPELKLFLKEDSNILNFQKLFQIISYEENLKDFMLFVFNLHTIPDDFTTLKEETSLQRNMKTYLLEGNQLHIGNAILKNER